MQITIKVEPSETCQIKKVNLQDLNLTEEEWATKTQEEKEEILNEYCGDPPEQPYWIVDSFKEE